MILRRKFVHYGFQDILGERERESQQWLGNNKEKKMKIKEVSPDLKRGTCLLHRDVAAC